VTWVHLEDATDEGRFGGKALQLGVALRAGLPVPAAVALSVELVAALAQADARAVSALHRALDEVPGPVAVRSSALGEDSAAASFAGVHRTLLNVRTPADVAVAVEAVWQSARAPAARAYRGRLGIGGVPQVAVVIQTMVDADTAGVMFTRHPISGVDERLIEASSGPGDAVVSGRVVPDRYRLNRSGEVLERTPGCLSDGALHALHRLASRCESLFEGPQDIEWAFAGADLHLLQSRPVTRVR
jgi:pyruvate,water dikinase